MRGTAILLASTFLSGMAMADDTKEPMLTHAVYFDLKQDDAASVQALIDGCYKYLEPHDGIV